MPALLIARESRSPKTVGGCSLDPGSRERFSQNLVRARRGANASNGGSGGDRGINKSGRCGNALRSRAIANLQSLESCWFEVFLSCWQGAFVNCRTDCARVCVDILDH